MKRLIRSHFVCILTLMLACASGAFGQKADPQSQDLNIRAYIELLRSDLRAQKVAVIAEVMSFTEDEAVKFWPVYQQYQAEIAKMMDRKLAGVKDYVENYQKMTDAKAKEITDLALQLEVDRVAVKRKYVEKMRQSLPAKTVGRFLQVENQIQFLMDLQIASSLPVIQ
jgi:hypothetical protein